MRWREEVTDGLTTQLVQRERVVRDEYTAIDLRARVLRKLEVGELFEDAKRLQPQITTLDSLFDGWMRSRAARGLSASTLASYATRITRILATFRRTRRLPEGRAIPAVVLDRGGVVEITNALRASGLAEGSIHGTVQTLVAAWSWASDDPKTYPGLMPAPRDKRDLVPRAPIYGETIAPTMRECDAVIREIMALGGKARRVALPVAVVGRCTGLRCGQVLGVRACDVDLDEGLLVVRIGKSRREAAQQRRVPLAPVLIPFLAHYVASARAVAPEAPLIPRRVGTTDQSGGGPNKTLARCWRAAVKGGDVRRSVWAPENRAIARPDHAFRAAFQAHLVEAGVSDAVLNLLVGHAGGLRDVFYGGAQARLDAMRVAVASVPSLPDGLGTP